MKRFIAIFLACLVVSSSMVAATTTGQQHARIEIGSTRIVIATAIRLLQWRFGIVPTSDGLIPPNPRPTSDGLIPPNPRPDGRATTCCK
jgi:hypothetical protein